MLIEVAKIIRISWDRMENLITKKQSRSLNKTQRSVIQHCLSRFILYFPELILLKQ